MTVEELTQQIDKIRDADLICRGRTGEFIAQTRLLQEHQREWNEKIEKCMSQIKAKLDALDRKIIRAASMASGAGVIIALLGKYAVQYIIGKPLP